MKEFPFDPYDFFGYIATGLLVLFACQLLIGTPTVTGIEHKPFDAVVLLIAAYVVGQVVDTPAKAFIEDLLTRRLLGSPTDNLMATKPPRLRSLLFPGYYIPLQDNIQDSIRKKATAEGLSEPKGEKLFLHIRFRDYITSNDKLAARLSIFLNRYAFNRTLCFASLAAGIAILVTRPFNASDDVTRYGMFAIALAIALFYRYLKFYRQYSYELFNTCQGRQ